MNFSRGDVAMTRFPHAKFPFLSVEPKLSP